MANSLALSLFFLSFQLLALVVSQRVDLSFAKQGKPLRLSHRTGALLIVGVAVIFLSIGVTALYFGTKDFLQWFYLGLCAASWVLMFLLVLPIKPLTVRLISSLIGSLLLCFILITWPSTIVQNLFMAGSLLWVGILWRLWLPPLRYFILGIVVAMAIDAYNIWFSSPLQPRFSDEALIANGTIRFGDSFSGTDEAVASYPNAAYLGIGDFFLAALIVAALARYRSVRLGVLAAVLFAGIRLLRLAVPAWEGIVVPYYAVMVPITLLLLLLPTPRAVASQP